MSAVRIVMVLCGGLFLVLGPLRRPGDGDLWWQRWLGEAILRSHMIPSRLGPETFSAPGAPWVPQEWIFSVLVAWAMQHSAFVAFSVVVSLIPAAILLSIYLRARGRASISATAVAMLLCALSLVASFGIRAQVLGWVCFAAFLLAAYRRDRWFYLVVPVTVVWANLHASMMIAPVYLVLYVIGEALEGGAGALRASRALRVLPIVALAVFCTPFGWHLPAYALALSVSPIRHYINEWQPASFKDLDFLIGALPLALILLVGLRSSLRRKAEVLPAMALFAAAVLAKRDIPLFAIAAAPLAAAALDAILPGIQKVQLRTREMEPFAIVAIAVVLAINGLTLVAIQRVEPPVLPVAAVAHLANGGQASRLLCEDFSHCSLALQYPNVRIFMDGRCDPYPVSVWKSYLTMVRARSDWQAALARYGVDAVVARRSGRLSAALASSGSWHRAYRDASFVLYKRT
ncbi:MAG TPA: hypothetical protein VJP76_03590 [Candidatus Tumulicola sp.]|nr:hypothetical protein [Candidatus Tumulicola sp.]